jgi:lambda family phage portal protein
MSGAELNLVDRMVAALSPERGIKRLAARRALAYYEAAKPSHLRKFYRDGMSPDRLVSQGAVPTRAQIRHLTRNHDLARGALRVLVNNVIGPSGIGVEFQPRRADGSIHKDYAAQLAEAYRDWQRKPEVTHRHHFSRCQRLAGATWFRDGEAFSQLLSGAVPGLDHGTRVPFSLELLEPDMVPMDYESTDRRIRQGIERNAWGRAVAYHVYRGHPGELMGLPTPGDLKRIPADRMVHVAEIDRIHQMRGVSTFASVITRLEDIKDYEESERVAAKVAAMLTAYVKRNAPADMGYDPANAPKDDAGNPLPRQISLAPGTIIDTLQAGEEIGLIDSKRPNPNLITFRQGQLRAMAAGIGASYSSVSRDYNGTYSAQRQELVEQWVHYAVLTDDFVGQWLLPVMQAFQVAAHLSGVAPIPADVKPGTADDILFIGQSMPWINPMHEAKAWETLVRCGFASEVEVARKRGVNPWGLIEQMKSYRDEVQGAGLVLASDAKNDKPGAWPALPTANQDESE